MLDPIVLMRRALRWVMDQHDIPSQAWTTLPTDAQQRLQELTIAVADDMRYNGLKYFRPFDHQKAFFTTTTDRRGILAANRIGKTVSTCYETAYHVTGLYPGWWTGHRFDKPITVMVAGEGWSQVALVLQQELLGTPDVKLRDQLGTGAIPRDCIIVCFGKFNNIYDLACASDTSWNRSHCAQIAACGCCVGQIGQIVARI